MLRNYNEQVGRVLEHAKQIAIKMGNNYVGSEHLLLGILNEPTSELKEVLAQRCIDYEMLYEDCKILFGLQENIEGELANTQIVDEILDDAYCLSQHAGRYEIDLNTLSEALLQTHHCVAAELLARYEIDGKELLQQLNKQDELEGFTELVNLNKRNKNPHVVARDQEIELILNILCRKEKANPLLIGEAGVGKSAIVEKIANMIEERQVPSALFGMTIYELNLNSLVAGTKYRGDFEEKLENIIQGLLHHPQTILFIDEIHQIIGAGKAEGSIDVSGVLKPYLARGGIKCIGATTLQEYDKFMAKDRALARRFQSVLVREPNEEHCAQMIEAKLDDYAQFHGVDLQTLNVRSLIDLTQIYLPAKKLPDKAFDVLDLACVNSARRDCRVGNEDVEKAIEQLSNIPFANEKRLSELKKGLQAVLHGQEDVIRKTLEQLALRNTSPIRKPAVWFLNGHKGTGKSSFIQALNEHYFHQKEVLDIDCLNYEATMEITASALKQEPLSSVVIRNLQEAPLALKEKLFAAFDQGTLLFNHEQVRLNHAYLLILGDFVQEGSAFLKNSLKQGLRAEIEKVADECFQFAELSEETKLQILQEKVGGQVGEINLLSIIRTTLSLDEAERMARRQLRLQTLKPEQIMV